MYIPYIYIFALFLPYTASSILVTILVQGRSCGGDARGGALIQHLLIQLLLGKGEKIPSAFKQLVRVAIASASLLHFPVSERQMNNNDCFVLLFSCLSKQHKTHISSFPCASFCVYREQQEKETFESGITVQNCSQSFLLCFFSNSKAVLLFLHCFLSYRAQLKRMIFMKGGSEKCVCSQV